MLTDIRYALDQLTRAKGYIREGSRLIALDALSRAQDALGRVHEAALAQEALDMDLDALFAEVALDLPAPEPFGVVFEASSITYGYDENGDSVLELEFA